MSIKGSCHCGGITFSVDATPSDAMQCNCSHCSRKGYLLSFFDVSQFTLNTPRDAISTYTFNQHEIKHQFCTTCGCAPFGEGKSPEGQDMVAVNLRCVEDIDLDKVTINQVDGASM